MNTLKLSKYNPVNKNINTLVKKKNNNNSISIITILRNPKFIKNIIDNFNRQTYPNKKLIIIPTNKIININNLKEKFKNNNVKIFSCNKYSNFAEYFNFGANQTNSYYISYFNEGNYYSSEYLSDSINKMKITKSDLVGKSIYYYYIKSINTLYVYKNGKENDYVEYVNSSTLVFKKNILNFIKFSNIPFITFEKFYKDCINKSFKIYSTDRNNFVHVNHKCLSNHQVESILSNKYTIIAKTNDYTGV